MINVRKRQDRGVSRLDWLESFHTFSFGNYQDPDHKGFKTLRVINEDVVAPGKGFATHAHDNMEIISYVLEGVLSHKDSMGNGSLIRPGDVQRMSAGTGVTHSEFNPSDQAPVHFLQIWVLPDTRDVTPSYAQKTFSSAQKQDQFCLVASKQGRDGSLTLHQDVDMWIATLERGKTLTYTPSPNRCLWVQLAKGEITLNGHPLRAGDGAAIGHEPSVLFEGITASEILVFDLKQGP